MYESKEAIEVVVVVRFDKKLSAGAAIAPANIVRLAAEAAILVSSFLFIIFSFVI